MGIFEKLFSVMMRIAIALEQIALNMGGTIQVEEQTTNKNKSAPKTKETPKVAETPPAVSGNKDFIAPTGSGPAQESQQVIVPEMQQVITPNLNTQPDDTGGGPETNMTLEQLFDSFRPVMQKYGEEVLRNEVSKINGAKKLSEVPSSRYRDLFRMVEAVINEPITRVGL